MRILNSVQPWSQTALGDFSYDAIIATIGSEVRSRWIPQQLSSRAARKFAVGYDERHSGCYDRNASWYHREAFQTQEVSDAEFEDYLGNTLRSLTQEPTRQLRICCDISAMTRQRMSEWLRVLKQEEIGGADILVDFLYAPARYSSPQAAPVENRSVSPLKGFAGWGKPSDRSVLVIGVGYEPNKAVGAVRYLDPDEVWAFIPSGHEEAFTTAVNDANEQLWEIVVESRHILYNVFSPYDTFAKLRSFVAGGLRNGAVTIVPLGPKIFSLCSLLVAYERTEVAVWRVSSVDEHPSTSCRPVGTCVGLRCDFNSSTGDTNAEM